MKECKRCGDIKSIEDFYLTKKGYRNGRCTDCLNTEQKERKRTPLGKIKQMYLSQKSSSKKRGHGKPDYTLEEFIDWAYANGYAGLHIKWIESGYQREKAPSADRVDDFQGYSLDNITLMTWGENDRKGHDDMTNGVGTQGEARCRGVHMHSLRGEFIRSFHSQSKAAEYIGCCRTAITNTVKNGGSCYGHIFTNMGSKPSKESIKQAVKHGAKKVWQITANNELIAIFNNAKDASNATGIPYSSIISACGRLGKGYGYYWRSIA